MNLVDINGVENFERFVNGIYPKPRFDDRLCLFFRASKYRTLRGSFVGEDAAIRRVDAIRFRGEKRRIKTNIFWTVIKPHLERVFCLF